MRNISNLSQRKKAVILGAGPVGLVTAWELLKNDWEVSIYEKANIVGGMCRTWKWDDFLVDTGPHIFHTSNQQVWEFVNRFSHFNQYRHRVFTRYAGAVYGMPINLGTINQFYKSSFSPDEAKAKIG